MVDPKSSRPPPLPPVVACHACGTAGVVVGARCQTCGYLTVEMPFNLHRWTTENPVHTIDDPPPRKTPSGFPLPPLPPFDFERPLSLSWDSPPGDPVADIQAALEPWEAGRTGPAPRNQAEYWEARIAAAKRTKRALLAESDAVAARMLERPPPWWLGPVRARDRYKRRELFRHAAASVSTIALGALLAIGLFAWFTR